MAEKNIVKLEKFGVVLGIIAIAIFGYLILFG